MENEILSETLTFEDAFKELDQILKSLESNEVGIDDSIKLYERGVFLKKFCEDQLKKAQLRIEKIVVENDEPRAISVPDLIS